MIFKKYYIKYIYNILCCTAGRRTIVYSCLISIHDMPLKEDKNNKLIITGNQILFFINIPFRNIINKTFKNVHILN